MTNIHLHGMLGRKFGKLWRLDVSSVAEAVRAIDANIGGLLRAYLSTDGREKKYRFRLGEYNVQDEMELKVSFGSTKDIHIIPVAKGAKSALGKILVGVALIGLMIWNPGSFFLAAGKLTMWGTIAAGMAGSLVLGGIVQALTPVPNYNTSANDEATRGSTTFQGNSLSVTQGGSVGLAYGRILVSPMPISVSLVNEDVSTSTTSTSTIGNVDMTNLPGGSIQYTDGGEQQVNTTIN